MKKIKAFTLIELLVATAIFLVIMLSLYISFHTGIFGYRNIEETIDIYQTASLVLGRMDLDLRNSFAYAKNETRFTGEGNSISFLSLVDTYEQDKLVKEYTFVSWYLEGNKLMRLTRRNKDALNEESETGPEEMSSNIEAISFSYGYKSGEAGVKFDKTSWDDKTKLPLAVRASLSLKGKTVQYFERTIYLPKGQ